MGSHCLSMPLQIYVVDDKNIHFVIKRFKG